MKKKIKKQALGLLALVVVMAVAFTAIPSKAASKKPTKMSLKVTARTIDIKGHATISVKSVKPSKASKAVTFKSGNKKIATVSSKGVVTGKKTGKVKITVTAKANKKLKKSVTMKVKDLKPTSISISASKAALYVGGTKTLKSTVKPSGVYCPVKWSSGNKAVATVSSTGKITAKKPGTATITVRATQKNNKKKYLAKSCKITVKVKNVPKRQVYVSPEWYKSAAEGQQPGYEHVFLAEVAYGKTENDKAYNEAHIPGAVHINSDAVEYDDWNLDGIDDQQLYEETEVKPEDNFNIRSAKQLGEFLKNNGITKDTKVVLYGRSASDSSVTRVAFAMLYAGVEDVKVIDGGMTAWNKLGLPTETKVNEASSVILVNAHNFTVSEGENAVITSIDGFSVESAGDVRIAVKKNPKYDITDAAKMQMEKVLADAEQKNEVDFTKESWNAYKEAVDAAKAISEKVAGAERVTAADYQNAIQAVKDAEAALVKAEAPKPEPEVKKVASVKLAKTSYVYDGKVKKPAVVAKNNKGEKITSKDYTVKYAAGCKNVGTYTVKVTFKGDYKGTFTKTFNINPKGTSFSKVKAARKSFSATWKKQSKQTSGYQLQYSTNKKFAKSVKTSTISKNTTVKKTVKKLKAKKTYYVRVRTYKTVKVGKKSVKIYSGWSAAKKVKTK